MRIPAELLKRFKTGEPFELNKAGDGDQEAGEEEAVS